MSSSSAGRRRSTPGSSRRDWFDVALVSFCAALHAALSRWSTAPDDPAAAAVLRRADHTKAALTWRRACSLASAFTAVVARSRSKIRRMPVEAPSFVIRKANEQ